MLARSQQFFKIVQQRSALPMAGNFISRPFSATDGGEEKGYVTDKADLKPSVLPNVPKRGSYKIMMEQGKTYFWCTCGKSEGQPWCDGSHKGTEFKPYKFVWEEESRRQSICGCKLNRDDRGPKCDRSHRLVDFEDLSQYKPGFHREEKWLDIWNQRDDLH